MSDMKNLGDKIISVECGKMFGFKCGGGDFGMVCQLFLYGWLKVVVVEKKCKCIILLG